MKPVIVHSEAQAELDEAVRFYERQQQGLGLGLLAEAEQAFGMIRENPVAWPPYKQGPLRHLPLSRFPYVIYYTEFADAIWIAAIAHGRRRPGYWRRRIRE